MHDGAARTWPSTAPGVPRGTYATGFLLPPLQTEQGPRAAARTIRQTGAALDLPLAVETGINYLRQQPWELSDGAFVARVSELADCDILLDLHNLWTNARNGRQCVADFLAEIPPQRIREIHLAGGSSSRATGSTRIPAWSRMWCSNWQQISSPACQA